MSVCLARVFVCTNVCELCSGVLGAVFAGSGRGHVPPSSGHQPGGVPADMTPPSAPIKDMHSASTAGAPSRKRVRECVCGRESRRANESARLVCCACNLLPSLLVAAASSLLSLFFFSSCSRHDAHANVRSCMHAVCLVCFPCPAARAKPPPTTRCPPPPFCCFVARLLSFQPGRCDREPHHTS